MKIVKYATAGTLESSDAYVEIEPGENGVTIQLEISVLAGIFILGDSFTPVQLLGIAVILLSVFGVSWQQSKQTEKV